MRMKRLALLCCLLLGLTYPVAGADLAQTLFDCGDVTVGFFDNLTGAPVRGFRIEFDREVVIVHKIEIGGYLPTTSGTSGTRFEFSGGELVPNATLELDWRPADARPVAAGWIDGISPGPCTDCESDAEGSFDIVCTMTRGDFRFTLPYGGTSTEASTTVSGGLTLRATPTSDQTTAALHLIDIDERLASSPIWVEGPCGSPIELETGDVHVRTEHASGSHGVMDLETGAFSLSFLVTPDVPFFDELGWDPFAFDVSESGTIDLTSGVWTATCDWTVTSGPLMFVQICADKGGTAESRPKKETLTEITKKKWKTWNEELGGTCKGTVCVFDYSEGRLCCTRDGESVVCCKAFSGNGPDANNPDSQDKPDKGPLPEGEWLIGRQRTDQAEPWYKLYHKEADGGYHYSGVGPNDRSGFNLHAGSASNGCLTVDAKAEENKPGATYPKNECFDKLSRMLNASEYKYKPGDTYSGKLFVQK